MLKRRSLRILFALVAILVVVGALLWLDLSNQGLAWRVFWSLTGEEAPTAQLRGIVELTGNLTRAQPRTEPYAPIRHAGVNPYGINTFLEQEVELAKREQQVQMIAEAGFGWIRQQFPWEDIEIHGRGDFIDRRNDPAGIDAWAKYDNIVDLAEQYGLRLQVRLDNPPNWTRANPDEGTLAPPDDWQDYYNFIVAVAQRYRGRVHHYQIWNEPNIYPEWGNNPVNPEEYTEMLCRAYELLKAVDPEIVVIAGALSPTVAITERDLSDFIFLQRMYDAGARGCFDVMSMQGYGFYSGPPDQRMRATTLNYARNQYIRDIMVANDDEHTPIWISEAAWNPVDAPEVPADLPGRENFGSVTPEQAARYMPLAYERAEQEWSWIGVVNYWFFKRATDQEQNQPFYYFRMVEPDFTPRPIYAAMLEYITTTTPTLYRGTHQADHYALTLAGGAESVAADGAQLSDATETISAEFQAAGTNVLIRWWVEEGTAITITVDGETQTITADGEGWQMSEIASSLLPEAHAVSIESETPFLLDAVIVYDRTMPNLMPIATAGIVLMAALIMVLVDVFMALRWRRNANA